jgi:two-component system sensor histidine kinase/response regulator
LTSFFDAIGNLFNSDGFVPRRICGLWPDWLVYEHIAGNALIWLAYLVLPMLLWRMKLRRPDWAHFSGVVVAFGLFIGLCGLGHFLDMVAFFYPMYRLSGLVLVATGLVSCWTAWSLRRVWPSFLAMRSPAELDRVIAERTEELVKATGALHESELRFRAIFNSTFQFIGLLTPDGTVLEINETALKFVGLTRDDVVGRPFWETPWWSPSQEACERLERAIADAGEGRFVRYEEDLHGVDGQVVTVDFSLKPILDDSEQVVLLIPESRDITARKQAEVDLASLASIVESSDDAIVGKNLDGVVTTWNRGAERIFGYTAAEAIGRPMTFLFPPDRLNEEAVILMRLRNGDSVDHFESVRLTSNGRAIDVSLTISPIKDRSGRVVGISKIARDITKRKQAEAKTRLMTEELERLFGQRTEELRQRIQLIDQAQDAIIVRSGTGLISSWNQGAERLYGWTREEAVGRMAHDLLKTQFPAKLAEIEGELASLGVWAGELTHQRRDGAQVVVASRWVLDRDGTDEEAVLEINSDITERKLSIQRLKDSDARMVAILAATADAILTIDEWGLVESLNPAAERLFGYPMEELIGQNIKILMPDPYHGEHDGYLANYWDTGLEKIIGFGRDVVGCRKDGTTFPMQLAVSELRLGDRRMFTGIARENTEREKAEAARDARDAAMRASRVKSEFLANMSHEIRTPMNGILGMTELLLDTHLEDLQRSYARTIYNSGEALLTVINAILDFSKIEAGKLTLEPVEFDIRELMEELADLLTPGAIRKGLRLNYQVAREVPRRLVGDPMRIRQILTNLAGNAVKFTERGQIDLEALLLDEADDRATLRVIVRDSSVGIPTDRQADIFESFTQIEGGSSRQHGGTGLGLTICQSLVELMDGRIGVQSGGLGEGSMFWFELTLGKGTHEGDLPAIRLDGLRVLVVDDQEADREVLRGMLLSWDCRPEVVASGAEALTRLLTDPDGDSFGLIVVDQEMPEMDGEQTTRVIKAMPRYTQVPIVLLTMVGPPTPEAVEGGLWAARIVKPVRRSLLYNVLCRTANGPDLLRASRSAGGLREMKLASPLRILLAEDNEVNREVAIGMLERLGCEVEAAWNGREAVEALDYDRHDLILMDIQMPVMDGFIATAAIRERERDSGRHIPIIALTAHAIQGDRARCVAAGMDDYLSKPIRLGPLAEALRAWGDTSKPAPIEKVPRRESEVPSPFAEQIRVSCGNDLKLTRKVLELMLKGVPVRLERLGTAINAGDESQRLEEAHSLKGGFATVGAQALTSACQEMMVVGKRESAAIAEIYRIILDQWESLEKEANHYLETLRP